MLSLQTGVLPLRAAYLQGVERVASFKGCLPFRKLRLVSDRQIFCLSLLLVNPFFSYSLKMPVVKHF